MATLATLTPTDVDRGVLQDMLNDAGITDVHEYAKEFHRQTENLVVEDLQKSDAAAADETTPIITPLDMQAWWKSMAPRLGENADSTVQSQTPVEEQRSLPTGDLSAWLQSMAPSSKESAAASQGPEAALQKPPASLDNWLKRIVTKHLDQLAGKATTSTGRLNSYLNAAQEIFNEFSGGAAPQKVAAAPPTAGRPSRLADVKQMYFLVNLRSSAVRRLVST